MAGVVDDITTQIIIAQTLRDQGTCGLRPDSQGVVIADDIVAHVNRDMVMAWAKRAGNSEAASFALFDRVIEDPHVHVYAIAFIEKHHHRNAVGKTTQVMLLSQIKIRFATPLLPCTKM